MTRKVMKNLRISLLKDRHLKRSLSVAAAAARVLFLGGKSVGKTTLFASRRNQEVSSHEDNDDDSSYQLNVSVDGKEDQLLLVLDMLHDLQNIKTFVWAVCPKVVVIVYDITVGQTLTDAETILKKIQKLVVWRLLVANKSDCGGDSDQSVSLENGRQLADKYGTEFLEVSALTGQHVDDLYKLIARLVSDDNPQIPQMAAINPETGSPHPSLDTLSDTSELNISGSSSSGSDPKQDIDIIE
ncbi:GTPase RhebL1-like isoform X2 [Oppia nitens]|uniref:GTPase RhebL1-like isoform X2 n=1 Tax=Oppia nitens TaxID=1686743 RepID=UPI0023DBA47B|nr:GTPase RhebL1-like isoform X2 [Oppia nitens]